MGIWCWGSMLSQNRPIDSSPFDSCVLYGFTSERWEESIRKRYNMEEMIPDQ